jgi:hypothetical protein
MLFVLLGLGLFLLGAMAFAVDLSNLWFNRQSAQTAADAACTAGAMDLLLDATNGTTAQGGFTAGTAFGCNASDTNPKPLSSPCQYATLNGFGSSVKAGSTGLGNNVSVTFPASVPGVTTPPSAVAPTAFMQVTVTDNIPTFFAGMLKGQTKQSVRAIAVCGVAQSAAPIPILILDPNSPKSTPPQAAMNIQGSGTVAIFGGPSRSIQVNSSATAGSCSGSNCSLNIPWGSETIDLSHGGPSGTGSDIGITGAPTAPPGGFNGGTTGHWVAPAAPIMDPFAQVCFPGQTTNCNTTINGFSAPSVPGAPTVPSDEGAARFPASPCTSIPCSVAYRDHGCPDLGATRANGNCLLYTAGSYPSGISVSSAGGGSKIALFDPGLYYITGGLSFGSGSTVRPGTGAGDGSQGVTFYFNGTGTINVVANSGTKSGIDDFNTLTGPIDSAGNPYPNDATHKNVTYTMGVKCASGSSVPNNISNGGAGVNIGSDAGNSPATQLGANLLMGPCSGYYGDPLGALEPASIGIQRWFLFFQDRSATGLNGNNHPIFQGNGQFLLAGTMYFHSCNSSGSGVSCTPPPVPALNSSYYQDIFQIQGNSTSGTYVLGDIVADNLMLGGGGSINMDLNPTNAFNILKASLYQ